MASGRPTYPWPTTTTRSGRPSITRSPPGGQRRQRRSAVSAQAAHPGQFRVAGRRRRPTRGRQPRLRRARVVSALVRVTSPAAASCRVTAYGPPGQAPHGVDQRGQARLLAAADVEHRRGAGRRHGPDRGVDGVVDVGEVPGLSPVAVERERRAVERRLAEPADRHVGPLAGPVDREVAQPDHLEAEMAVHVGEPLARALGDAVRRARRGRRGVLAERRVAGASPYTDDDEAYTTRGQPAAVRGLEHALGGEDVVVQVAVEARAEAGPHAGLGGEVEHHAGGRRSSRSKPLVGDVRRDQVEAGLVGEAARGCATCRPGRSRS